jgi:hypothetical protein
MKGFPFGLFLMDFSEVSWAQNVFWKTVVNPTVSVLFRNTEQTDFSRCNKIENARAHFGGQLSILQ